MYAEVAVCLPLVRTFVYELSAPLDVGCRVVVPFRKREVEGFVVGQRKEAPKNIEVHPIAGVIDQTPLLRSDILELCRWLSDYYLAPLGEVLRSALPPGITPRHMESNRKASNGGITQCSRPGLKGVEESGLTLTDDQMRALGLIDAGKGFGCTLLHGVTGSGKTEVYMRAADLFLERGKSVLILVPEIGLTPQLTNRFADRFPGKTAMIHSALTKRQRIDEWLNIYRGETPIVIGTRSAVFAPVQRLGLIVVDEEHETSYKQEELPRYNARDTAVMRGKLARATVVLGSATPSMESFRNAQEKKYQYIGMTTRVEDRPLPGVEIVNMRDEYASEGTQVIFSRRLLEAIAVRAERSEQTMILLNRRGYAAFLLCRHCGFTFKCNSCSVALTYHRAIDKLLCHYCGSARRPPARCPDCDSEYIHYVGEGTERLEAELKKFFPDVRIGRIDRDAMRHLRDYHRVLGEFRAGDIDILVGTQMIAKGHDFPRVTLVGVINADAALSLPDFRAAERTFQLLTQVAGRSGRGDRPGEVMIQSFFPDHYTFQLACTQRFEDFYARESRYRKAMFYPPFTALAGVMVTDRDALRASKIAKETAEFLDSVRSPAIRILGPAPAPLERIKRVHRHQLLIKSSSRMALHEMIEKLQRQIEEKKIGSTKIILDVDPISLL
jgi:primosomal protein N' (replication factor Y)